MKPIDRYQVLPHHKIQEFHEANFAAQFWDLPRSGGVGLLGAIGVNDKEHKRNLRRLAKAIEASNEMLRKAGIQVRGAEQPIHVPEQKPEFRPRTTK